MGAGCLLPVPMPWATPSTNVLGVVPPQMSAVGSIHAGPLRWLGSVRPWEFASPWNAHVEILTLSATVSGGRAFGRSLGREGGALLTGISTLIEEAHPVHQERTQLPLWIPHLTRLAPDLRPQPPER